MTDPMLTDEFETRVVRFRREMEAEGWQVVQNRDEKPSGLVVLHLTVSAWVRRMAPAPAPAGPAEKPKGGAR